MFASASLVRSLAAAVVWAIDDGEKIKEDEPPSALAAGEGNPVWSPGAPIRLVALRNETIAFQIIIAAPEASLARVTVDLDVLTAGESKIANAPGATDPTRFVGRPIERFVEHFFDVPRASGGTDEGRFAGESLGWTAGSAPRGNWTGRLPDALVPVEVAPAWRPYPLAIAPKQNGIVWIDVTVGRDQPAGIYRGDVVVRTNGAPLATLPLELDVGEATLPERPLRTMLHYDRDELDRRLGREAGAAATLHLAQLLHRHRLTPMLGALTTTDVTAKLPYLDGSAYGASAGYEGPAMGMGDGVLSLGTYGDLGDPAPAKLRVVEEIAELLDAKGLLATTDTFVYAADEDCESPRARGWADLLAGSTSAAVKKVRVAWTCTSDARKQPVDVSIQAEHLDTRQIAKARALGKEVWAYNGRLPWTGTFLTDTPAITTRVNGWLASIFEIERWFYWESTAWFDENKGGHGPYDPFVQAETFHNKTGNWSMGDGLLLYPGKQVAPFDAHSIGMNGVLASIRLKNWRRGIQDAGYYALAHAADPKAAEAIARALVPAAFERATEGKPAAWSEAGKPWFEARRSLRALVPRGANGGPGRGALPAPRVAPPKTRGCGGCESSGRPLGGVLLFAVVALFLRSRATRALRR